MTTNFLSASCRFCLAKYTELQTDPSEKIYTPRTNQDLRNGRHCVQISPFAELDYADLSTLFPPDTFHDLSEGVVKKFLSVILRHHLKTENDVYLFNSSLGRFSFDNGPIAELRFPERSASGKGSSVYEFFKRAPEFFNPNTFDQMFWNLLLLLREFDALINSPRLSSFKKLFTNERERESERV